MNFSNEKECTILEKQMLTDEFINITQSQNSFQRSVVSKTQILHDSSLHWVCVANMESRKKDNEIHYLYDSLKKRHISKDVTA